MADNSLHYILSKSSKLHKIANIKRKPITQQDSAQTAYVVDLSTKQHLFNYSYTNKYVVLLLSWICTQTCAAYLWLKSIILFTDKVSGLEHVSCTKSGI